MHPQNSTLISWHIYKVMNKNTRNGRLHWNINLFVLLHSNVTYHVSTGEKNSFCPLWWGLFTGMAVRWILKRLWTDFDDFFSVDGVSDKLESDVISAGRSGLAVACLTAVRQVLGSNRAGPVVFITQPLRFTALGTGCVHLSCSA